MVLVRKEGFVQLSRSLQTLSEALGHFRNALGTLWKPFGNALETLWKPFGNALETLWKLVGNPLETLCKPVRNPLETLWNCNGACVVIILECLSKVNNAASEKCFVFNTESPSIYRSIKSFI